MEMQPIEPNRQMSATLTAEQWDAVLRAVNELPHRVARNIFDALMQQLMPPRFSTEELAELKVFQQKETNT